MSSRAAHDVAREGAHVLQHGDSPEAEAARVLRAFMCCDAGRDLVEHGLLRPFGFSLAPGRVLATNSQLRDALEQLVACVEDETDVLREGGDATDVVDALTQACATARRRLDQLSSVHDHPGDGTTPDRTNRS